MERRLNSFANRALRSYLLPGSELGDNVTIVLQDYILDSFVSAIVNHSSIASHTIAFSSDSSVLVLKAVNAGRESVLLFPGIATLSV